VSLLVDIVNSNHVPL